LNFKYFIQLSYKGTNYHGWQIQPDNISVQLVLNKAFSTILNTEIELVGAGRTDTGVHASYYIAHFEHSEKIADIDNFIFRLNRFLPKDIAIYSIKEVKPNAHARFDAISRTYQYHISKRKDPFNDDFALEYSGQLDIDKMNKMADILCQHSNFKSFSKLHSDNKTDICKVFLAKWEKTNNQLIFTIKADRFLRNMVRSIVGTLLEVGKGHINEQEFESIILAKDRCAAGQSVSAKGLFLTYIEYPEDVYAVII